jgi:ElaB/YqjD/DUF883 family membrane-anchored ribosome-binding protein
MEAPSTIGGTVGRYEEDAKELGVQAQRQAHGLADQALVKVRAAVEERASDLGARATGTAEDLRGVAEYLRSQDKDGPAGVAEGAAEQVARVGDYLQAGDADRLIRDAEQFGRERPWAVMVSGAAVGLAASRMLKVASAERYRSSAQRSGDSAAAPTEGRPAGSQPFEQGPDGSGSDDE